MSPRRQEGNFQPRPHKRRRLEAAVDGQSEETAKLHVENITALSIQDDAQMKQTRILENEIEAMQSPKRVTTREKMHLDNLPLDVITEIVARLRPSELLALTRTTRGFRCLLLAKANRYMWTAAMDIVGMPRCPPDLNEPQYADLVFGSECHLCGISGVRELDFALRVRLCKSCFSTNVVQGHIIARELGNRIADDENIYYMLVPSSESWTDSPRHLRFYRPHFLALIHQYISLPTDENDREAQARFLALRQTLMRDMVKHAGEVEKWMVKQRNLVMK